MDTLRIDVSDVTFHIYRYDLNRADIGLAVPADVRMSFRFLGHTYSDLLVQRGDDNKLYITESGEVDSDNDEVFGVFLAGLVAQDTLSEAELAQVFDRVFKAARDAIQIEEAKTTRH